MVHDMKTLAEMMLVLIEMGQHITLLRNIHYTSFPSPFKSTVSYRYQNLVIPEPMSALVLLSVFVVLDLATSKVITGLIPTCDSVHS